MNQPRPLLAFAPPTVERIPSGPPQGRPRVQRPSAGQQGRRLAPQFAALQAALREERALLEDATSAPDPELVVVFDLAGTVDGFVRAVRDIEGLEFLAELDEDPDEPDSDFYFAEPDGSQAAKVVPQSLYMVMTNAQAAQELVRLFDAWRQDPTIKFPHGSAALRQAFELLRAVRLWGPEDRVRETGLLDEWAEQLQVVGRQGLSRVEVELWYRTDPNDRSTAARQVQAVITAGGGSIVAVSEHGNIGYHAILADLPTHHVQRVLDEGPGALDLLVDHRIMFVSPSRPMSIGNTEPGAIAPERVAQLPEGPPRLALLDGLPLANHPYLAGRLVVDDPDDVAGRYHSTVHQSHGTAMASLLAHGDLAAPSTPMQRTIYVRPVLQPDPYDGREQIDPERLFVDVIARAFQRMFEGDGSSAPAAPSVRIVSLSLGEPLRGFVRHMSPLARLIDWYTHRYNLVVLISAGNQPPPILDEALLGDRDHDDAVLARALRETIRHRRLLAPAEAVNAVTVGAVHDDGAIAGVPDTVVDLVSRGAPASYTSVGFGHRRSVKPEILMPGGRQVFIRPVAPTEPPILLTPAKTAVSGPGLLTAAPGPTAEVGAVRYDCGTSHATALGARAADQIMSSLEQLRADPGEPPFPDPQFHPVLTKALLIHAAAWGDVGDEINKILDLDAALRRRGLTQLLGYGLVSPNRVATAASNRPVLIGAGAIAADQRQTFHFPLPQSLSGTSASRALTITLAWLSPINTRSQRYRVARLRFSPPTSELRVNRHEADHNAVVRGTVQHERLIGSSATVYRQGQALAINVDCRADAGIRHRPLRARSLSRGRGRGPGRRPC